MASPPSVRHLTSVPHCRTLCGAFLRASCAVPYNPAMIRLSCADILAGRANSDSPVTVAGWVRTRRDSKAGLSFVHISDGSGFHPVQVVAPAALPNYASEVMRLTAGCAVEATGK